MECLRKHSHCKKPLMRVNALINPSKKSLHKSRILLYSKFRRNSSRMNKLRIFNKIPLDLSSVRPTNFKLKVMVKILLCLSPPMAV